MSSWSKSAAFAIGLVVLGAAIAVLAAEGQKIAWCFVLIGGGLMGWPFYLDWKYGSFRPSKREIDRMSASEYRDHLRSKKFTNYVNHLFKNSGRYQ